MSQQDQGPEVAEGQEMAMAEVQVNNIEWGPELAHDGPGAQEPNNEALVQESQPIYNLMLTRWEQLTEEPITT